MWTKRRPILNRADAVETILNAWREAGHWLVGRYVIMPDHIHFSRRLWPRRRSRSGWSSGASQLHAIGNGEKPIWQKDFFDRQLRSGESYREKWPYIWQNPIVARFCSRPEDWPWQGELNVLQWHEPAA